MKKALFIAITIIVMHLLVVQKIHGQNIWSNVRSSSIELKGKRLIIPDKSRTVRVEMAKLQQILSRTPMENTPAANKNRNTILILPMPDGSNERFRIVEAPIMAPELAAKFPEIKTYKARGMDTPTATGRLDFTPKGFHAMIVSPKGTIYIDPYSSKNLSLYNVYYKNDYRSHGTKSFIEFEPIDERSPEDIRLIEEQRSSENGMQYRTGGSFRTYRAAISCTGEYAAFHGGTVPLALAAITTTLNRVNIVYERDLSLTMQLVANNDQLIFLNGATDPYDNNNAGTLINQSQTQIDGIIGDANYDIGHTVSTGGGGLAGLGVVCISGQKGRGITGSTAPIGDPFDIDFVAHEIGHQFSGNHTFNGAIGNCSGGNRNGTTAYEPGSGTTIQAYAGICGADNIQNNSNDYFHVMSLDEMTIFSTLGSGNSCPATTPIGNNAPVVTVDPVGTYTIPVSTPFTLTGSATDADGDPLTYCWEQFDLGSQESPTNAASTGPLFRSFPPTTNTSRTFPQISDIINNTQTIGELLPTISRSLTFRLTARDNGVTGLGGCIGTASTTVNVDNSAGPFLVTAPNTAVTWMVGDAETVTWDVANTTAAPVSCANVDILLSTDGGNTYPVTLASNVPNDGSHDITVPNNEGSSVRVQIVCSDNIFFDISNTNFIISGPGCPNYNTASSNVTEVCNNDANALTITSSVSDCTGIPGTPVEYITDGSFELGAGSGNWAESSSAFGSPLCSTALCGGGTPADGTFFIWGGGGAVDNGYVEQAVTFPTNNATLEFQLSCANGPAANTFTVTVDGNSEYSINATNSFCNGGYTLVSVDLSAYADGMPHTVRLAYSTDATYSWFMDAVTLFEIPTTPLSNITVTWTVDGTPQAPVSQTCGNIDQSFTLAHSGDPCLVDVQNISYVATCDNDPSITVSSGSFDISVYPPVQSPTIVADDATCNYSVVFACPLLDSEGAGTSVDGSIEAPGYAGANVAVEVTNGQCTTTFPTISKPACAVACPTSTTPTETADNCDGATPTLPDAAILAALNNPALSTGTVAWYTDAARTLAYANTAIAHSGADNCLTEMVTLYAEVTCLSDASKIAAGQLDLTVYPSYDATLLTITNGNCTTTPALTSSCGNYVITPDAGNIGAPPAAGITGNNSYDITWGTCIAETILVPYVCANFTLANSFNPTDPCSCNDDQTADGAQDGTFAETVSVTGDPGDIIMGQIWTVTAIAPLAGAAMPTLPGGGAIVINTTPLTFDGNGAENRYFLDIEHTDDNGYNISIEGPAAVGDGGNTTVQITNLCEYPEISSITGINASYTVDDASITSSMVLEISSPINSGTLVYTIAPALPSGFTDNGNGTFTFDPTAGDENNYTITATFTPTAPFTNSGGTAADPGYPGDICETVETFNFDITASTCTPNNGVISITTN